MSTSSLQIAVVEISSLNDTSVTSSSFCFKQQLASSPCVDSDSSTEASVLIVGDLRCSSFLDGEAASSNSTFGITSSPSHSSSSSRYESSSESINEVELSTSSAFATRDAAAAASTTACSSVHPDSNAFNLASSAAACIESRICASLIRRSFLRWRRKRASSSKSACLCAFDFSRLVLHDCIVSKA